MQAPYCISMLYSLLHFKSCKSIAATPSPAIRPEGVEGFNELPTELKVKIFGILAQNGELWIRLVNDEWRGFADTAIECLWNAQQMELSKTRRGSQFTILMDQARSNTVNKSHLASFNYLNRFCRQHLLMEFPEAKEGVVPVTLERSIVKKELKKGERIINENLVRIWPCIQHELKLANPLATAEEIKIYLRNPENKDALAQIEELDLSGLGLTLLPPEIECLTGLKRLNLANNTLDRLPVHLEHLTQLSVLSIHGNPFRTVPSVIEKLLPNLHILIFHIDDLYAWMERDKNRNRQMAFFLLGNPPLGDMPMPQSGQENLILLPEGRFIASYVPQTIQVWNLEL